VLPLFFLLFSVITDFARVFAMEREAPCCGDSAEDSSVEAKLHDLFNSPTPSDEILSVCSSPTVPTKRKRYESRFSISTDDEEQDVELGAAGDGNGDYLQSDGSRQDSDGVAEGDDVGGMDGSDCQAAADDHLSVEDDDDGQSSIEEEKDDGETSNSAADGVAVSCDDSYEGERNDLRAQRFSSLQRFDKMEAESDNEDGKHSAVLDMEEEEDLEVSSSVILESGAERFSPVEATPEVILRDVEQTQQTFPVEVTPEIIPENVQPNQQSSPAEATPEVVPENVEPIQQRSPAGAGILQAEISPPMVDVTAFVPVAPGPGIVAPIPSAVVRLLMPIRHHSSRIVRAAVIPPHAMPRTAVPRRPNPFDIAHIPYPVEPLAVTIPVHLARLGLLRNEPVRRADYPYLSVTQPSALVFSGPKVEVFRTADDDFSDFNVSDSMTTVCIFFLSLILIKKMNDKIIPFCACAPFFFFSPSSLRTRCSTTEIGGLIL
jgi:hypothetical protein